MGKITKQEKQDYKDAKANGTLGPKERVWPTNAEVKTAVRESGRAVRGR